MKKLSRIFLGAILTGIAIGAPGLNAFAQPAPGGGDKPPVVNLGGAVNQVINFSDPRMPEAAFRQKLVDEIVSDDLAIRLGTTASYEASVRRQAEASVTDAARHFPGDRNRIISEAYAAMTNSQPREPMFPYRDSPFLAGSDYAKKCR